jgi:hypothetical protein
LDEGQEGIALLLILQDLRSRRKPKSCRILPRPGFETGGFAEDRNDLPGAGLQGQRRRQSPGFGGPSVALAGVADGIVQVRPRVRLVLDPEQVPDGAGAVHAPVP